MTGALTGSDASDHSDPVFLSVDYRVLADPAAWLDPRKIVLWIAIAAVVYAASVLIGIAIARGVEAALGWLS
jgi:hypothetical protein